MVLNHSSSEHPWFQAALRDTTSPYRSWYRFSPTDLGKGPWGAEAWHRSPVRDEYYYGVFWSGMPDLNYQTPAVARRGKEDRDVLAARHGRGRLPSRCGPVPGGGGQLP